MIRKEGEERGEIQSRIEEETQTPFSVDSFFIFAENRSNLQSSAVDVFRPTLDRFLEVKGGEGIRMYSRVPWVSLVGGRFFRPLGNRLPLMVMPRRGRKREARGQEGSSRWKKKAEKVLENPAAASRRRFVEREGIVARVPPPDRLTFTEG